MDFTLRCSDLKCILILLGLFYSLSISAQKESNWLSTKLNFEIGVSSMLEDVVINYPHACFDYCNSTGTENAWSRFIGIGITMNLNSRIEIDFKAQRRERNFDEFSVDSWGRVAYQQKDLKTTSTVGQLNFNYEILNSGRFKLNALFGSALHLRNGYSSRARNSVFFANGLKASHYLGGTTYLVSNLEYHIGLNSDEIDFLQVSIGLAKDITKER